MMPGQNLLQRHNKPYTGKPIQTRMNIIDRYNWACTTPSDIAEHVPILLRYGHVCDRITEFGVRAGVSTSAWLGAEPDRLICYDRNVPECLPELTEIARANKIEFQFVQNDTALVHIEPTDLLFIDTTHDDPTVRAELFNNHRAVSKYIILHDTELFGWNGEGPGTSGLSPAGILYPLMDFLLENPEWRVRQHLKNSCGLTVLEHC